MVEDEERREGRSILRLYCSLVLDAVLITVAELGEPYLNRLLTQPFC